MTEFARIAALVLAALVIVVVVGWLLWLAAPLIVICIQAVGTFVGTAFSIASSVVQLILAIFIEVCAALLAIGVVAAISVWGAKLIAREVAKALRELGTASHEAREEMRVAGRDATFTGVVSLIASLILYIVTDEFIKGMTELSTIRGMAAAAVGVGIAKFIMMFPSRVAKLAGIGLSIFLFCLSVLFLLVRAKAYAALKWPVDAGTAQFIAQIVGNEPVRLTILVAILLLECLAFFYPFKPAEWSRMLGIRRSGRAIREESAL